VPPDTLSWMADQRDSAPARQGHYSGSSKDRRRARRLEERIAENAAARVLGQLGAIPPAVPPELHILCNVRRDGAVINVGGVNFILSGMYRMSAWTNLADYLNSAYWDRNLASWPWGRGLW